MEGPELSWNERKFLKAGIDQCFLEESVGSRRNTGIDNGDYPFQWVDDLESAADAVKNLRLGSEDHIDWL